jgi:TRAP-type C4-dicarboxylate transport system permease small subunit
LLKRIDHSLQTAETWLAAGSLFLLLALSIFQILLRNILDFGYPEIDIVNRHLLVICGMMGATLATSKRLHIKTDALNILLSPAMRNNLRLPLSLFSSIVCLMLSYYASIFVIDEWQYIPPNERWTLPFTLIFPLSFALMSCHFILNEMVEKKSA